MIYSSDTRQRINFYNILFDLKYNKHLGPVKNCLYEASLAYFLILKGYIYKNYRLRRNFSGAGEILIGLQKYYSKKSQL